MEQKALRELEEKCIQECAPTCTAACPAHVDVRSMLREIGRGDFTAALKTYRKAVPFPGIICLICDRPCQDVCRREDAGEAIAIRDLERAAVEYGDTAADKSKPIPKCGGRVAVGGGISGLAAAHELARKGYGVSILEAGSRLGGSLWRLDRDYLPGWVIEHDLESIAKLGIDVQLNTRIDGDLPDLRHEFDAVYLAVGPRTDAAFDLAADAYGFIETDPVTFATSIEGIFAGGGMRWGREMHSSITSISEGRRAAISIDRFLQRVSLTASRVNEGPYPSCLYTDTAGIEPEPAVEAADHWLGYSQEEAALEANRCIQCECMECVKVCEYLRHFERYPRRYVREVYNNLSIVKGTRYANDFINACSLCGLCAEVCPNGLAMGEVNLDARQTMVAQKRMPSTFDFALRDMAFSNSDQFAMSRHAPGAQVSDAVFFPGCQLCASSPGHVESVYAYLNAQLENQKVGLMLGCCGAPAHWAGQVDLFQQTLAQRRDQLRAMGNPRVILPCSSCHQMFREHLPDVEIVSLWEIYDRYGLPEDRPQPTETPPFHPVISIHDPCSARHERAVQDSVRRLVTQMGYQIEELRLSREKTVCCSYGGHMWLGNKEIAQKVVRRRVAESDSDYITYCAMCRDFFAGQDKRAVHLLDLIYHPAQYYERAARRNPGWSERHENRARLKRRMLKSIWGEEMDGSQAHESIRLFVDEVVRDRLEARLILTEDIQRVIEYAERTGRRLLNKTSGHYLAYYRPTAVTYWVEYLPQDDGFAVFNAYSHRMEVPGSQEK